ncbi:MAG: putative glycoside hydrolase [Elusimicrobia bacterium]|nr:putative glycoside hydrolase [Elusimicrobiota bacterium]
MIFTLLIAAFLAPTVPVQAQAPDVDLVSAAAEAPASAADLRGAHVTGWAAGSLRMRRRFFDAMTDAGFNAVVVALKDSDGRVFVPGVALAERQGAYVAAIPDLPGLARDIKGRGFYAIARIAVFKDDHMARARPDLAVRFPDGRVWEGDNGTAWLDPYLSETRDYAVEVASRAAAAGFDEIQFDYIRFPSDGKTRLCRYARKDSTPETEAAALKEFLAQARGALRPLGVKLSLCIFGLTTSVDSGMGIGQRLAEMASYVDYVSPMMYPSHYAKGEYGLKSPNRQPYLTIRRGIADALARLGPQGGKLRPYLQDFSLGVRYTPAHVRSQIRAAEELGVRGWILWNPQNRYAWSAIQAGPIVRLRSRAPSADALGEEPPR